MWVTNEYGTALTGISLFQPLQNEKKAICALIVPFHQTVMGPGLVEEPPLDVPKTYEEEDMEGVPAFVQVCEKPGSEPIVPLSALKPCPETSVMPELLYERQQVGQSPHNFGFVYEHDGRNRVAARDEDVLFMDLFAGSGGYHQGVMQVPGFKGVAAVEYWDKACDTFKKNHPDTPVYHQKVEDFLDEYGPTPIQFREKRKPCMEQSWIVFSLLENELTRDMLMVLLFLPSPLQTGTSRSSCAVHLASPFRDQIVMWITIAKRTYTAKASASNFLTPCAFQGL